MFGKSLASWSGTESNFNLSAGALEVAIYMRKAGCGLCSGSFCGACCISGTRAVLLVAANRKRHPGPPLWVFSSVLKTHKNRCLAKATSHFRGNLPCPRARTYCGEPSGCLLDVMLPDSWQFSPRLYTFWAGHLNDASSLASTMKSSPLPTFSASRAGRPTLFVGPRSCPHQRNCPFFGSSTPGSEEW